MNSNKEDYDDCDWEIELNNYSKIRAMIEDGISEDYDCDELSINSDIVGNITIR